MRPYFTGSTLERVRICPASEALPGVRMDTDGAQRGKAIHEYLATVGTLGKDEALARVDEEFRAACALIELDRLPQIDARGYAAEVAFALDVELGTAHELGRNLNRRYPTLRPSEVPLTVDSIALCADGEGIGVWDYKTGRAYVPPAIRNAQLALGALAGCRAYGRTYAHVGIVYVRDDGTSWVDRATLDEWALDEFAASLRKVAEDVQEARGLWDHGFIPTVTSGPHCTYCPAKAHCPAHTAMIRAASNPDELRMEFHRALTPERARSAYTNWKMLKEIVQRFGDELDSYARAHPIDLGDGRFYGPRLSTRESVDGTIAYEVLSHLYGAKVADDACSLSTTKKAISEAIKASLIPGEKLAPIERRALEEIRKAGGISTTGSDYCKEYVKRDES